VKKTQNKVYIRRPRSSRSVPIESPYATYVSDKL